MGPDLPRENHQKVVFFFNGGQGDGTATDIYFIDDVIFDVFDPCSGIPINNSIVNDFECQQNYTIGLNPSVISVIENIDTSGLNTSDFVG